MLGCVGAAASSPIRPASSTHSARGKSCPIPSITTSSAPGSPRRRTTAADVDQRISRAVNHERRRVEDAQPCGPVARRDHRDGLPHHTERIERAVEGATRAVGDGVDIGRKTRRADDTERIDGSLHACRAGRRRRASEDAHRLGMRLSHRGIAGARHDRGQRPNAARMFDRHRLRDDAAHRRADDVRASSPSASSKPTVSAAMSDSLYDADE